MGSGKLPSGEASVRYLGTALNSYLWSTQAIETGTEVIDENVGFLACARQFLSIANTHSGSADLVTKIESNMTSGDTAIIVGHGSPGLQCSGNGDHCHDGTDSVSLKFDSTWQPLFSQLRGKVQSITLIGCQIGKAPLGGTFLSELAKATNATVTAPSNFITCDGNTGFTILNGGTWVQATPTSGAPFVYDKVQTGPIKATDNYRFKVQSGFVSVAPSNVKILSFLHREIHRRRLPRCPSHAIATAVD
jgi:hypothetical protein